MLIQQLRDNRLAARRSAAVDPTNAIVALTLGTVIAEATRDTKEPTDEQTLKALRRVRAGVQELQNYGFDPTRFVEIEYLSTYIPDTLTVGQTHDAVMDTGLQVSLRNMRAIKAELEAKYPGRVDGQILALVIKEWAQDLTAE
jgi:hypothetical protein